MRKKHTISNKNCKAKKSATVEPKLQCSVMSMAAAFVIQTELACSMCFAL
jgi:hypothetical protein